MENILMLDLLTSGPGFHCYHLKIIFLNQFVVFLLEFLQYERNQNYSNQLLDIE